MTPLRHRLLIAIAIVVLAVPTRLSTRQARAIDWVDRSNAHARLLLEVTARLAPESAARIGVDGFDEAITDLAPGFEARAIDAYRGVIAQLRTRLASESHPQVRQDLAILIESAENSITGTELGLKYSIPYVNVASTVFNGIRALLDDQVAPSRRPAALVRLRKYAGLEPGTTPYTELAMTLARGRMGGTGRSYPIRASIEQGLNDSRSFLENLPALFDKYGVAGYDGPLAALTKQVEAYNAFARSELMPKSRGDFRQPPEVYAYLLKQSGIDLPPTDLARQAHAAFADIQRDLQALAPRVAAEHGWTLRDYRDVLRELKKDQLVGDAILPHYQARLKDIEAIIVREKLATLPARPARIRLASPAETAASPIPNMRTPRLVGNTGEQGEFVLPLNVPTTDGRALTMDDFTFAAASWTLTAHEARPGHEMQFAGMLDAGVSTTRALFAFNSTNVEGWGLYAEHILQPFMPVDGQFISLQMRMMRAARAFLDPELQSGAITIADARRVLTGDVGVSEALAKEEIDRYTFRQPGQAAAYFYGYTRLLQLRADVERAQGASFNARAFHDFVLAQGLLPPGLLREAVMAHFTPALTPAGN